MKSLRHIALAKAWTAVLVFMLAIALFGDARFALTPERWDSWYFPKEMKYKQAGLEIDNTSPEKGIWLSSRTAHLQERGKPNWWISGLAALSLVQIIRHLSKARTEMLKAVRSGKL